MPGQRLNGAPSELCTQLADHGINEAFEFGRLATIGVVDHVNGPRWGFIGLQHLDQATGTQALARQVLSNKSDAETFQGRGEEGLGGGG